MPETMTMVVLPLFIIMAFLCGASVVTALSFKRSSDLQNAILKREIAEATLKLEQERKTFQDTQQRIQTVHNDTVKQLADVADKVDAMAMAKTGGRKSTIPGFPG